jgi:hypothetical protein
VHTLPLLGYAHPDAQTAIAAATAAADVGDPAVAQRRPDAHREPSRPDAHREPSRHEPPVEHLPPPQRSRPTTP